MCRRSGTLKWRSFPRSSGIRAGRRRPTFAASWKCVWRKQYAGLGVLELNELRSFRPTIQFTNWSVFNDFFGFTRSPRFCKSLKNLKLEDCHIRG